MYCRAANMFKMAKNWSGEQIFPPTFIYLFICAKSKTFTFSSPAAGNAFCKAARLHMQMQNKHDCATSFIDAGNAYKKSDPNGKTFKIKLHVFVFL